MIQKIQKIQKKFKIYFIGDRKFGDQWSRKFEGQCARNFFDIYLVLDTIRGK